MRVPRGRRAAAWLALLAAIGAGAFVILTRPSPLDASAIPPHRPDLARGEALFHAGSCLACHAAPKDAPERREGVPSGGNAFPTPVGVFYPQNLTPDAETGLGLWSDLDFANAMVRGISPAGLHYFPAFPYPSYHFMPITDLLDLRGYLMSLPPVRSPNREPDMPLVSVARRGVGLWKRWGLDEGTFSPDPDRDAAWNRGAYLVRGPGHCGECHTPRNWLMVPDESRYLAGGPHPRGEGSVPSLRGLVARERYEDAADLTLALQYGETFGYDKLSSGGMGDIQASLARLEEGDVRAIAEYLVSLD